MSGVVMFCVPVQVTATSGAQAQFAIISPSFSHVACAPVAASAAAVTLETLAVTLAEKRGTSHVHVIK